jgi:SAM-dependent methyltransferase
LRLHLAWSKKHSFDDTKPIFWDNDKQNRLTMAIHFPTDKGWMSANKCYAGKSWDGPESFDEFFKEIPDRGILSTLKDWEESFRDEDISVIKGKLRYAGVSWEPKVLKFEAKTEQDELDFKGYPKYPPNCWKDLIPDIDWEKYCKSLSPNKYDRKTEFERDAKLKKQWTIEYFLGALPLKALDRIKIIKPLAERIMQDMPRMTFTSTERNEARGTSSLDSFAYWQLSKIAWLPSKPSLIYKDRWISPSDGYLPGKGLGGLLPEIDIALDDNQEGRDIETLLVKTLKVRETLPREDEPQWRKWLNDLPEHVASFPDKEKALKSVKKLWEKVLTFKDASRLTNIDKIPPALNMHDSFLFHDFMSDSPLNIDPESAELVYSSHCFEHLPQESVKRLLAEIYRVLKQGGTFRMNCPDADLVFMAWQNKIYEYFDQWKNILSRPLSGGEYFLLFIAGQLVDGLITPEERIACNIPKITDRELEEMFSREKNRYAVFDQLNAMCKLEVQKKHPELHINWFTADKLESLLKTAGFKTIRKMGYTQTQIPVFMDTRFFEFTAPWLSVFIEAEK